MKIARAELCKRLISNSYFSSMPKKIRILDELLCSTVVCTNTFLVDLIKTGLLAYISILSWAKLKLEPSNFPPPCR